MNQLMRERVMDHFNDAAEIVAEAVRDYKVIDDVKLKKGDPNPYVHLQVLRAGINGNPGQESTLSEVNKDGLNTHRFDFGIKLANLRSLKENDVRRVMLEVVQEQFKKIPYGNGTLADIYDFSDTSLSTSAMPGKIKPVISINTGLTDEFRSHDAVHFLSSLPRNIGIHDVIAGITSREQAIQNTGPIKADLKIVSGGLPIAPEQPAAVPLIAAGAQPSENPLTLLTNALSQSAAPAVNDNDTKTDVELDITAGGTKEVTATTTEPTKLHMKIHQEPYKGTHKAPLMPGDNAKQWTPIAAQAAAARAKITNGRGAA
jgi:hypothetical protein